MTTPDLSIVIPTYDTAELTLRCVGSLRSPAGRGNAAIEVIVVDDASRDGTAALLAREAPHVRVISMPRNSGFAAAANRGVRESRGKIVLLLNSDAVVEDGAVRALLEAFAREERLGVAGARLLNADGTPQWSGGRTPALAWMIAVVSGLGHLARFFRRGAQRTQKNVDWVSGAALAFRREAFTPLDEQYAFYCQDIDFCLRARENGWNVRIVEDARVMHDIGGTMARGTAMKHDPEKLWPDLLRFGRLRYGRRWATFARGVLVCVAWLRIAMRRDRTLIRAARRLAQSES